MSKAQSWSEFVACSIASMSTAEMAELVETLVYKDECQANRLKNLITVTQQEYDNQYLEQEKQYEMMSKESDNYAI
jgi:hypothetical protein